MDRIEVAVLGASINAECCVRTERAVDAASPEDFGEWRDGAAVTVLAVGGVEALNQAPFSPPSPTRPKRSSARGDRPLGHAVVCCVDQKAAIQALDRLILSCRFHAVALSGAVSSTTAT